MSMPLLDVQSLTTTFRVRSGGWRGRQETLHAVEDVSLQLAEGEVLGLVGESGCGKSTLARTIVRLVAPTAGHVFFEGHDLAALNAHALRRIRPRLQMIFQDPYASLNPRRTIHDALAEPMAVHKVVPAREIAGEVARLMERVGLARNATRKYPHEFSGGQRQRIAIARALALRPKLIIADEPVSALDVSVQAQILNLLRELCVQERLAMLLISHDLSVVRHMAQRIAVMYLGRIIETAQSRDIFARPMHPYTKALLSAIPLPDPDREALRQHMLLKGDPPSPIHPPAGCTFHPRCPWMVQGCKEIVPPLDEYAPAHRAACIRVPEIPQSNAAGAITPAHQVVQ